MHDKILAAYIRLSIEDGDLQLNGKTESNSVANQRLLIQDYIHSHTEFEGQRIEFFCDDGYTGTNFNRPEFQRMMMLMKLNKISCIIVKDLSRFGREYLDVGSYLELLLPLFNVRFISINDGFDSNDYLGTTGGIELAFRNLINGLYSKDISMKVRSACKTRFRKGEYIGSSPFYGYIRDPKDMHRLIVDENVRRIIERIFEMCIDGHSCKAIARILNEESIPCPLEYKRLKGKEKNRRTAEEVAVWISCTVRKILKDERYTGKMVSNTRESVGVGKKEMVNLPKEEWIIIKDTHERSVSDEVFERANAALSARVRTINYNTSWKNSGNLFVCGCCGRRLQKTGSKDTGLYCMQSLYHSVSECSSIHGDLRSLENAVLETVKGIGRVFVNSVVIVRKKEETFTRDNEKRLKRLEREIGIIRTKKMKLYEKYRDAEISKDEYIRNQMLLVEKQKNTENTIMREKEKEKKNIELIKKAARIEREVRSIELLESYDPFILGKIVERVIVFGENRIEVILKNRDVFDDIISFVKAEGA